jgi:hypothetical protein
MWLSNAREPVRSVTPSNIMPCPFSDGELERKRFIFIGAKKHTEVVTDERPRTATCTYLCKKEQRSTTGPGPDDARSDLL